MFDEFMQVIDLLLSYPTVVPFAGLIISLAILFISMVTIGFDTDMELPSEIGGFDNPLVTAGLSKVPLFIGLTLTFLPMTIITAILDYYLIAPFESTLSNIGLFGDIIFYAVTLLGLFGVFIGSLHVAGFLSKPIEKALQKTVFKVEFNGLVAEVSSGKLNKEFGEIRVFIGYREYILFAEPDEDIVLETGDKVIIHGRHSETGKYLVVPQQKSLANSETIVNN